MPKCSIVRRTRFANFWQIPVFRVITSIANNLQMCWQHRQSARMRYVHREISRSRNQLPKSVRIRASPKIARLRPMFRKRHAKLHKRPKEFGSLDVKERRCNKLKNQTTMSSNRIRSPKNIMISLTIQKVKVSMEIVSNKSHTCNTRHAQTSNVFAKTCVSVWRK